MGVVPFNSESVANYFAWENQQAMHKNSTSRVGRVELLPRKTIKRLLGEHLYSSECTV